MFRAEQGFQDGTTMAAGLGIGSRSAKRFWWSSQPSAGPVRLSLRESRWLLDSLERRIFSAAERKEDGPAVLTLGGPARRAKCVDWVGRKAYAALARQSLGSAGDSRHPLSDPLAGGLLDQT